MISRESLKQVILEQRSIPLPGNYINRQAGPQIAKLANSDLILIITGIRRCGKSVVLKKIRLDRKGDYYLNFDDDRLINFTIEDFQTLYEVFIELFGEQKSFYFDEIQNIAGWERFVRRLHDHGNKVFITGSNATMLSKELGTHLTGRHITITLYPFSFYEFVQYYDEDLLFIFNTNKTLTTQQTGKMRALFNEYLLIGGFPGYLNERLPEYLQSIYENILFRDIIVRYKISKEHELRQLAFFIASNIGKRITFNSIRKMLNLGNYNSVADYFQFLENCYLSFIVNIYNPSLKTQFANEKKQYFIDHGLARLVGFRTSDDEGRILENIVYIELLRRKHNIYVHNGPPECDFILHENNHITAAIQVCKDLSDPETEKREYNGLLHAMQQYQLKIGLILTENTNVDKIVESNDQEFKIEIRSIWQWLLH